MMRHIFHKTISYVTITEGFELELPINAEVIDALLITNGLVDLFFEADNPSTETSVRKYYGIAYDIEDHAYIQDGWKYIKTFQHRQATAGWYFVSIFEQR